MEKFLCKIYFALEKTFGETEAERIVKILIEALNL